MNLEVQNSVFYSFSPLHKIAFSWFATGFCPESVCISLSFCAIKSTCGFSFDKHCGVTILQCAVLPACKMKTYAGVFSGFCKNCTE